MNALLPSRPIFLSCAFTAILFLVLTANAYSQTKPAIQITPWLGPTSGTVTNQNGERLAEVLVTFYGYRPLDRSHPNWYQTKTDSNGEYQFPPDAGIRHTRATIQFVHPDYAFHSMQIEHGKHCEIEMVEGRTLKGRIVDPDGIAVTGAAISLFTYESIPEWLERWTANTDENGGFEIAHAPPSDRIPIRIRKPGVVWETVDWYSPEAELPERLYPEGTIIFGQNKIVQGEEFTFKTFTRFKANIEARNLDTDQPVQLKRIAFENRFPNQPFNKQSIRSLKDGDCINSPTFSNINYGKHRFCCFPEEDSGLLGSYFNETFKKGSTDLEKVIHLRPGISIKGTVRCSETSEPVSRVSIEYIPDDEIAFQKLSIIPQYNIRTDKEGKFEILVPKIAGELRMVGPVFGFVTIDEKTAMTDDLRSRFSLKITADIQPIDDAELLLKPAPKVKFRVVNSQDEPVVGAFWTATHRRDKGDHPWPEFGVTDQAGMFTSTQMFDHATIDYDKADEVSNRGDGEMIRTILRNQVRCWDADAGLIASSVITPDDFKSGNPFSIAMIPGASVSGKLVDELSGEPIANAGIMAREGRFSSGGLSWRTKTDEEGNFEVTNLLPNTDYQFNSYTDVRFRKSFRTGMQTEPIELGELKALSIKKLVAKITPPDIAGLSAEDALDKLIEFVEEQKTKAPSRQETGSWSAGEPRQLALNSVARAMNKPLKKILEGNEDTEFRCNLYLQMIEACTDSDFGVTPRTTWTNDARNFLIENIDFEGVFDKYRRMSWGMDSPFYASTIFKNSQKREIRAWAYQQMLWGKQRSCVFALMDFSDQPEKLDEYLTRMEEFWKTGMAFSDVDENLPERVLGSISRVIETLQQKEADDELVEKVERLKKRIDPSNKN